MRRSLSLWKALAFAGLLVCTPVSSYAAFEMNFAPYSAPDLPADFPKGGYDNSGNPFACPNAANPDCSNGTEISSDPTGFYYERVWISGKEYFHVIIGDPSTDDFALETYIPTLSQFHSTSGGREPIFFTLDGNLEQWSGNGWDPLEFTATPYGPDNSSFSGNGTGDPTQVVVRQLLGTGSLSGTGDVKTWNCDPGQFCQEYLKAEQGFKPIITQSYTAPDLVLAFELDMSTISYSDGGTAATMVNTVQVISPNMPAPGTQYPVSPVFNYDSANFDVNDHASTMDLHAGKYIYTAGQGWYDDKDGDVFRGYEPGSYTYGDEGGPNDGHLDIEWSHYYDPAQNPAGAYPGNKALCDNTTTAVCDNPPSAMGF